MKRFLFLAPVALIAACGGNDDSGAAAAGPSGTQQTQATVTFHEHVEPILQARCQTCHHEGGIGPFTLITYDEAFRQASQIAKQASARTMPPWGQATTDECTPRHKFRGDPTLTQAEIDTLATWLAEGAKEGDPAKAPAPKKFDEELLSGVTEDWKIPTPYLVKAGLSDEFMCFVIDPKLTETTYLDGVAFVPGNPQVSHHALAFVDPTGEAKKLADADGKYPCFGGPMAAGSLMTAWAPGVPPADFGTRIGLEVPAGAVLVVQMHYHPKEDSDQLDQTKIVVRKRSTTPEYIAKTRLIGNSQSANGFIKLLPGMNDDNGVEFRIPAGASNHVETMEYAHSQKKPLRIASVGAHMHWVGVDMKIDIERKTPPADQPASECLIQTPRYDFNWQRGYAYDADIEALPTLEAGDTVRIRCTYNNTMDNRGVRKALAEKHLTAPQVVTLGEETLDEMCLGAFTILEPSK